MIVPVILSGGSGTRLWPLSRKHYPKQFANLLDGPTLFQKAALRLPRDASNPLIICNEEHRFIVAEQLREINVDSSGIILEPIGKNTAPAIALAALRELNHGNDPYLLILSADHIVQKVDAFHQAATTALAIAKQGKIVTFGIQPDRPETGYGYIKTSLHNAQKVEKFVEKPNLSLAKEYLASNQYLWNSGMFMFQASTYINELRKFEPEILDCCQKSCKKQTKDLDFIRIQTVEFEKCPSKSIDYAVLEHSKQVAVVSADIGWSDVGSWHSLWQEQNKDSHGNTAIGKTYTQNTENCYINSSNRSIATLGVSDLAIIDTKDSLLVADINKSQDIKGLVESIAKDNPSLTKEHTEVLRPWGYYQTMDIGNDFQVKKLTVKPHSRLSLQKHRYRSEHWIVVHGEAVVTNGNEVLHLTANQSTYIPAGNVHRIENKKDQNLEIIEVQTGSYLGEDDIVRLEDDYKRHQ